MTEQGKTICLRCFCVLNDDFKNDQPLEELGLHCHATLSTAMFFNVFISV